MAWSKPTTPPSGYNSTPPSDDGSNVSSNEISWAKHINKIATPLLAYADGLSTQLDNFFTTTDFTATSKQLDIFEGGLSQDASTFQAWGTGYRVLYQSSTSGVASIDDKTYLFENVYNDGSNWIYLTTSHASLLELSAGEVKAYTAASGTAAATATMNVQLTISETGLAGTGALTGYAIDNCVIGGVTPAAITGTTITGATVVGTTAVQTDSIIENTPANGVVIDGVTLKDSGGTFSATVTVDTSASLEMHGGDVVVKTANGATTAASLVRSSTDTGVLELSTGGSKNIELHAGNESYINNGKALIIGNNALAAPYGSASGGDLVVVSDLFTSSILESVTDTGVVIDGVTLKDNGVTASGTSSFAGGTIGDLGTVTTADINGGTIDGVIIGGASAAALTCTALTSNGIDDNATSTQITVTDSNTTFAGTTTTAGALLSGAFTGTTTLRNQLAGVDVDIGITAGVGHIGTSTSNSFALETGGTAFLTGDTSQNAAFAGDVSVNGTAAIWTSGTGTPEGAVTAPVGSMFTRTDGGAGTTLYVKESGAGNTGWVGK